MQISAKVVAHHYSIYTFQEIITFELEYPRFIHAELMTHRMFSRNAASSRAIPVAKMLEQVETEPAMPVHWGKNQAGMQAKEELDAMGRLRARVGWYDAARDAAKHASSLSALGAHKQIVNRILEPFQMMKTIVTATSFDNFFWLRRHPDAQPEIKELANRMWEAASVSGAAPLFAGEWHTPYYKNGSWRPFCEGSNVDHPGLEEGTTLQDALAISTSCCAQVSYRKLDDSVEKARAIFTKLIESKPCHASPTEHQATPMRDEILGDDGITHLDKDGHLWSGNFRGWIQHRQLINGNVCNNYQEEA